MAMIKLRSKTMQKEQIENFLEDDDSDIEDADIQNEDSLGLDLSANMFKYYSSYNEVEKIFNNRQPLFVVKLKAENDFFCIVKNNNEMVQLRCGELSCMSSTGAAYHLWDLVSNEGQRNLCTPTNDAIQHYRILLPKLSKRGLPNQGDENIYTLIN